MDYIQSTNKQVDKFGAGAHGFSAGNPSGGVPATFLSNVWCDDVMMEIINVLLAGGVAPAANTRNQLLTALRSAGVFTTPSTGDRSTKAATTQMFANEFANSLGPGGYQKLPSGLIVQWGSGAISATNVNITFPLAFPTACYDVLVSENSGNGWTGSAFSVYGPYSKTTTGVSVRGLTWNGSTWNNATNANFDYFAIGK